MSTPLDGRQATAIAQAAQALADGRLLGLPTETVYGLGADADNASAVARIFSAKGRPSNHPLIVHVAGSTEAEWWPAVLHYATDVPDFALRLMRAFWPGPLTLILPRREVVGAVAAGGQNSIGLRCPSHPVAQAVLHAARPLGVWGVAAPSANRFGRVSPTTAAHVVSEFEGVLSDAELCVLDGGPCDVGIESTIVDASRGHPVLLRPGMLTAAHIEAVCGQPLRARDEQAPRASGTLESHYAPQAKVRLMDAQQIQSALDVLGADARHIAVYTRSRVKSASKHLVQRAMPGDAAACAQELFAVLRAFDDAGVKLIWIEMPPPAPEWDGVRDRLQRAAA
ncbi:MAG TPA: L-threonylcarbamoyladenylate synthase [Burkholderiaceae bacterium]|nr:L-threonylcarbamoyladenylate synthase [Burkholderiaceae bacterium]